MTQLSRVFLDIIDMVPITLLNCGYKVLDINRTVAHMADVLWRTGVNIHTSFQVGCGPIPDPSRLILEPKGLFLGLRGLTTGFMGLISGLIGRISMISISNNVLISILINIVIFIDII